MAKNFGIVFQVDVMTVDESFRATPVSHRRDQCLSVFKDFCNEGIASLGDLGFVGIQNFGAAYPMGAEDGRKEPVWVCDFLAAFSTQLTREQFNEIAQLAGSYKGFSEFGNISMDKFSREYAEIRGIKL